MSLTRSCCVDVVVNSCPLGIRPRDLESTWAEKRSQATAATPRTIKVMIWNLIGKAERSWRLFLNTRPGDRFQVRYYRRQQSGPGRLSMIFNLVAGTVLVIFSAFFGWAPGPGLLSFLLGLALIGGEFLPVARRSE